MGLYEAINAAPLYRIEAMPPRYAQFALICENEDLESSLKSFAECSHKPFCIVPLQNDSSLGKCVEFCYAGESQYIPVLRMEALPRLPHLEVCYYSKTQAYQPLHSVVTRLHALGLHVLYLLRPPLGISEGMRHDPSFLDRNAERLEAIYDFLADEISKQVFAARLKALLTGNMGFLFLSDYPCYAHPLVPCSSGFIVVDGGCAWGGIETFATLVGPTGHVWGFEPDQQGFLQAQTSRSRLAHGGRVTLSHCGLWHENTVKNFSCLGSSTCVAREEYKGQTQAVSLVRLDDFVHEHGIPHVDFLKLDVEGAECHVLEGAQQTLSACRPNLAICIYHNNSQDLVDVPEFICNSDLGYRMYIGQHAANIYDTVLYAVSER